MRETPPAVDAFDKKIRLKILEATDAGEPILAAQERIKHETRAEWLRILSGENPDILPFPHSDHDEPPPRAA